MKKQPIVVIIVVLALGIGAYFLWFNKPHSASKTSAPDVHEEHKGEAAGEGHGHEEHKEEIVRLSEEAMREFGVETAVAGPSQLRREIQIPGEVRLNETKMAHLVPRFPGVVMSVRHKLGDTVKAGEVMAVIESNESLVPYELKSLVDGTVISQHIALGEVLETSSQPFVVADLSTVWVDFSVYQKDIGMVRENQSVTIVAPHGLGTATGKISYLGPTMSETTRTALARVELPNPERRWLPGMFVTGRVEVEKKDYPLVIPQTAIQVFEDRESVFVKTKDGFVPRPVKLGQKDSASAEVLDGLAHGETFVAKGAFHLKADLLKGTLGDGHQH
jgi:cobalt-zinc-cadmium efflux system membrane fusion protein